jgi:transcriptional regulator NrdR family protein
MALEIIKASGRTEEFNRQKLVDSLIRSGATEDDAWISQASREPDKAPDAYKAYL